MTTCSICPTSARMVGRVFPKVVRISICSPRTFDQFHEVRDHAVQVQIDGFDDLAAGERQQLSRQRGRLFCTAEYLVEIRQTIFVSSTFIFSISPIPKTPVRALLKSWAIPPARVPTASIRWAAWNCRSNSVFSVTSWTIDRTPVTFPDASRNDALNHSQVMTFPVFPATSAFRE